MPGSVTSLIDPQANQNALGTQAKSKPSAGNRASLSEIQGEMKDHPGSGGGMHRKSPVPLVAAFCLFP
jgi:hypothetical protein